jgi:hypothetical protein
MPTDAIEPEPGVRVKDVLFVTTEVTRHNAQVLGPQRR